MLFGKRGSNGEIESSNGSGKVSMLGPLQMTTLLHGMRVVTVNSIIVGT